MSAANELRDLSVPLAASNYAKHSSYEAQRDELEIEASFRSQAASQGERNWEPVSDLDSFFLKAYIYYRENGFWVLVFLRLSNLLIVAFTVIFSVFLLLWVDWVAILQCHSRDRCDDVIWIRSPSLSSPSFSQVIILIYGFVFTLYWVWNLASFVFAIRDGLEMKIFFSERLHIEDDALEAIEWNTIVERIVRLQEYQKISIVRDHDALDICNRIMRRDNYLIAMINQDIIDLGLPIPGLANRKVFGKAIEWTIRMSILNVMFDDEFRLRPQFREGSPAVRRRFIHLGILSAILLPFILMFMLVFFFLQNAEQLQTKKNTLGPRSWVPWAQWAQREINELDHIFQARLERSHKPAQEYLDLFPASLVSICAQFVAYVSGAVVGVLLLLTLVDSSALINLRLFDRTLLWFLAVFSTLLALSRSLITNPSAGRPSLEVLEEIHTHTHYLPPRWRQEGHLRRFRDVFATLYRNKLFIFFQEIISVLMTPFVLCVTLPSCLDRLARFLDQVTVHVPGVGDLCGYAVYDWERFGNWDYLPAELRRVRGRRPSLLVNRPSANGKMEKSFVAFALNNPSWVPPAAGNEVLSSFVSMAQPLDRSRSNMVEDELVTSHVPARNTRFAAEPVEPSASMMALAMNVSQIILPRANSAARREQNLSSAAPPESEVTSPRSASSQALPFMTGDEVIQTEVRVNDKLRRSLMDSIDRCYEERNAERRI